MEPNEFGHLIVGVDIGMTYTGVAYSWNNSPVRVIQNWKGKHPRAKNDKVPTILSYKNGDLNGGGELEQWGFGCDRQQPHVEWFKPYLDPKVLGEFQRNLPTQAYTPKAISRFYVDFLTELYNWIKHIMTKTTNSKRANFRNAKVEFLFSLPSTINSPEIAERFREYFHQAGFARGGLSHSAELGLTEPEAAAVDAVTNSDQSFEPGDILLVVDAGGGTTDICVLELEGTISQPSFRELLPVRGINVGSTNIDEAFKDLAKRKIQNSGLRIKDCSWIMVNSEDYDLEKCTCGEDLSQPGFVWIRVPGLSEDHTDDRQGIRKGKMLFTPDEFKGLFDPQIDAIESAIRAQLDEFGRIHPIVQLDHLVLCGSLGSSAYVRNEIEARLTGESSNSNVHPRAQRMRITVSHDPQLAVAKGLVIDRMRNAKIGRPVLTSRRSRLSYGILYKVPFDARIHNSEDKVIDEVDGKEYANGRIKWIIKKGAMITPNETILLHNWKQRYLPNASNRIVEDPIVVSDLDEYQLPKTFGEKGVEKVCTVESDFSDVEDSELKKAHKSGPWYKRHGELFYILEHNIRVLIGAASDLQVHSIFNDKRYEKETHPVKIGNLEDRALS